MSGLQDLAATIAGLRRRAALALALLGVAVSFALQLAVHEGVLAPPPSHATRYAVSGVLGLRAGQGLTVANEEALAVKEVRGDEDLLALHRPEAPRVRAHEPLPGVILVFAAVARATGALRLDDVARLQAALHAVLAALLFLALRRDQPLAALLGAGAWAVFVPQFRTTLSPGHDALSSFAYLGSVVALLHFHRTGGRGALVAAGAACGAGLWLRSFFGLILPVYAGWLLARGPGPRAPGGAPGRGRGAGGRLAVLAGFAAPVVVAAVGLWAVRSDPGFDRLFFVRGAMWHNFWGGVGQFENDLGLVGTDKSVHAFAEQRSGERFDMPNYQYDPRYNAVLGEAGRVWVPEHVDRLAANAARRLGWLVFPAFMPSVVFAAAPPVRALLVAAGVPVSLLALVGFAILHRSDPARAWLLAAPWLSLVPLCLYFLSAKVPTQVWFGPLVLAATALEARVTGGPIRGMRPALEGGARRADGSRHGRHGPG